MITPGRSLVGVAAGIGLCGSLAGVVLMHPMGLLAQASAHQTTPVAATQADFAPTVDTTADPEVATAPLVVNVYQATEAGTLGPAVAGIPERVYVPNSASGTLDVIDPTTFGVVAHYYVGAVPHHVAPAWDLSRLYVDAEGSGMLSVIDPP